ncbi:CG43341 [Drosophila busckii]|uniref:CG43341 n=1 Tax=Drosophila busckii TaxID=30019 RepID=A0A0M3QV95_DROBS|nr:uncharacterized protein LOC108596320 [Drosophila busckii]ALC42029.1 CG43341 [Drosophila busckii]
MFFNAVVLCQVEKLLCAPISLAVFAFLVMACTMEVVLLKLTTSPQVFGGDPDDWPEADESAQEERIYYENVENNYESYARRRWRFQQRQQLLLAQQQQQQQQL